MDQPSDFGGLFSCQRVVVVGANGAGKTWFARRLGAALSLDVTHNDALVLTSGWHRRPPNVVCAARNEIAQRNSWIIEGGPSILSGDVLTRAEAIVWLDPPRRLRLWRVLLRTMRFMGRQRPEHPPGNREWPGQRQWRFLTKTWTHDTVARVAIGKGVKEGPAQVFHLTTSRALEAALASPGNGSRQSAKRL